MDPTKAVSTCQFKSDTEEKAVKMEFTQVQKCRLKCDGLFTFSLSAYLIKTGNTTVTGNL